MKFLNLICRLTVFVAVTALVNCAKVEKQFPLLEDSPCEITGFIDIKKGTINTVTRDVNGKVVKITQDDGFSHMYKYDDEGNLVNYNNKQFFEYDSVDRLVKEVTNNRTIEYSYQNDEVIVLVDGTATGKYYQFNAMGLPERYEDIVGDPSMCSRDRSFMYDSEGNLIYESSSPCRFRGYDIEYIYNNQWTNPDPFPQRGFLQTKPKKALVYLFSNGGGPSGTTLERSYKYEWNSESRELSVYLSTTYGNDTEHTIEELYRVYNVDCWNN